jgi:hypothetical protein
MWNSRNVSWEPGIQQYVQDYSVRTLNEETVLSVNFISTEVGNNTLVSVVNCTGSLENSFLSHISLQASRLPTKILSPTGPPIHL